MGMVKAVRSLTVVSRWVSVWLGVVAAGCSTDRAPTADPDVQQIASALTGTLSSDFEDGTAQGWFPFGGPTVASSTDVANTGTHSLLTTDRTAGFMGPGISLTGQLTAAANYHVSVAARLMAGQAATGLKVTVMRSFADGTNAFDSVVPSTPVTDQAWVTLQNSYSFASSTNSSGSALSGIILYVESDSATASYYIDTFSLTRPRPHRSPMTSRTARRRVGFPFGSASVLTNTTEQAFAGTHSLQTTEPHARASWDRASAHQGSSPRAPPTGDVSGRLADRRGRRAPAATFQRTPTGGSAAFDFRSLRTPASPTGLGDHDRHLHVHHATTGLLLYVETHPANASYYIDSFSIVQLAPAPGPPGNTAGAASTSRADDRGVDVAHRRRDGRRTAPPTRTAARPAC